MTPGLPPQPGALGPLLPEPAQQGNGELAQWGDRDAVPAPDPVLRLQHPPRKQEQQQAGLDRPEPAVPSQRPGTVAPTSPWRRAWHLGGLVSFPAGLLAPSHSSELIFRAPSARRAGEEGSGQAAITLVNSSSGFYPPTRKSSEGLGWKARQKRCFLRFWVQGGTAHGQEASSAVDILPSSPLACSPVVSGSPSRLPRAPKPLCFGVLSWLGFCLRCLAKAVCWRRC